MVVNGREWRNNYEFSSGSRAYLKGCSRFDAKKQVIFACFLSARPVLTLPQMEMLTSMLTIEEILMFTLIFCRKH